MESDDYDTEEEKITQVSKKQKTIYKHKSIKNIF